NTGMWVLSQHEIPQTGRIWPWVRDAIGVLALKPIDRCSEFSFGSFAAFPTFSFNPLARFQFLIPGEEVLNFFDQILLDVFKFFDVIVAWIILDTQHLVVTTAVVDRKSVV